MSSHEDAFGELILDPSALNRLWDSMNRQIAPVGGRTGAASLEAAATIQAVTDHDDARSPSSLAVETIWASIAAETLGVTVVIPPATAIPAPSTAATSRNWLGILQSAVRQAAIGAIAGFLVGSVVIGGGARILMRLAAMLSAAELTGAVTENGNHVGDITLSGTIGLLFFAGALPGLLGGIVVMAVRPWLPPRGWWRVVLAGLIGFAIAGSTVLERGDNADYRRFGILGLNVCLFTLLPFCFGMAVLPVIDALDCRIPHSIPSMRKGAPIMVLSIIMALLAFPLVPMAISAFRLEPAGLLLLLPVIRVIAPIWAQHAPTIAERRRRELRGLRIGQAAVVAPCLLGLVMMANAIARLMS